MKQIRFGLDRHLDADLIVRIERRANGGSINDAARFLLRFWFEQEQRRNLSPERQITAIECTDNDNDIGEVEINLSDLDVIFSELGE
jgi:hypothetical protein